MSPLGPFFPRFCFESATAHPIELPGPFLEVIPMLPMQSTMSDFQLTIGSIFEHGVRVHTESEVITWMGDHARRSTFREVGDRVRRLACALQRLGIRPGD